MPLFGQPKGNLGQTKVDVPLGIACLSFLEQGRGHMTGFSEDGDYLFWECF